MQRGSVSQGQAQGHVMWKEGVGRGAGGGRRLVTRQTARSPEQVCPGIVAALPGLNQAATVAVSLCLAGRRTVQPLGRCTLHTRQPWLGRECGEEHSANALCRGKVRGGGA